MIISPGLLGVFSVYRFSLGWAGSLRIKFSSSHILLYGLKINETRDTLYITETISLHTVSWLNSSVTLLVSKAPLNRTVKNGCFWVDPPFRFRVQKANFAFLFSGGLKKKADPLINFPLLTKSVTWDTVCCVRFYSQNRPTH